MTTQQTTETHCSRCGDAFAKYATSCTTGYGIDTVTGARHCFKCFGELDAARMTETGRATLYLTGEPLKVSNWPGTLSFPVAYHSTSRHNWGVPRTDFWFRGPDGAIWHGYQIGNNSQIAHCRRTKRRSF